MRLNYRAAIYALGMILVLLACGLLARNILFPMLESGSPPLQALAIGFSIFGVFAVWIGALIIWLNWAGNISCPSCDKPVYGKLPGAPERVKNFFAGFIPFLPSTQVECDHCGFDLRYASTAKPDADQKP